MECLLDNLIGRMRTVEVARIDVVYTGVNGLSQDPNGFVGIARRPPHLRTRQLHRPITHAVHRQRSVRNRKTSAEAGWFGHSFAPAIRQILARTAYLDA